jgi:ferredoxin
MTAETVSPPLVEVVFVDRLLNVNKRIRVPSGTVLLDGLKEVGFSYGPCGGLGQCGRCVVEISDGRLVQACFYTVREDITVRKWRGL